MAVTKKTCPYCKQLHTYKQYLACARKHKAKKETWSK